MINLVKNEWIKIFKRNGTYVMIGLVILGTLLTAILNQMIESMNNDDSSNWKQMLQEQNESYQVEYSNSEPGWYKDYLKSEMAINDYRIEHNLPPTDVTNTMWSFIHDSALMIDFVGLFVIIIAAGIVANEFTWGTIKLLLIKPFQRWKILLSKYLTVLLFLLLLLAILFASAAVIGALFFGFGDTSAIHLSYTNGQVIEQSLLLYLVKVYLLNSASTILLATMAFMISAAFRTSGLAIGLSIFLLLGGPVITNMMIPFFDWTKYTLFVNTNLMQYLEGPVLMDGMTMPFSLLMLAIYFVIFIVIAFAIFIKRDVRA